LRAVISIAPAGRSMVFMIDARVCLTSSFMREARSVFCAAVRCLNN
jgi:hypothetical protein